MVGSSGVGNSWLEVQGRKIMVGSSRLDVQSWEVQGSGGSGSKIKGGGSGLEVRVGPTGLEIHVHGLEDHRLEFHGSKFGVGF